MESTYYCPCSQCDIRRAERAKAGITVARDTKPTTGVDWAARKRATVEIARLEREIE